MKLGRTAVETIQKIYGYSEGLEIVRSINNQSFSVIRWKSLFALKAASEFKAAERNAAGPEMERTDTI